VTGKTADRCKDRAIFLFEQASEEIGATSKQFDFCVILPNSKSLFIPSNVSNGFIDELYISGSLANASCSSLSSQSAPMEHRVR
jgi:hypothetical protein